ncbi:MAG: hypothetical protein HY223_10320 [Thaumarchaeota archaeon]|nr:hypothetical protein [Nitrososphaerota archaeon]
MSYPAEVRKKIMETSDFLEQASKHYAEAGYLMEDGRDKHFTEGISKSAFFLSDLYRLIHGLMIDSNILFEAIEKLPKGVEFDNLKAQIEKMKEGREEVALQIPQNIENELKEWLQERERAKKAQGQYVK